MRFEWLFILILLISLEGRAKNNCLLAEALRDPKLSSNMDFWREYAALNERSKGAVAEADLQRLTSKYRVSGAAAATPPSAFVPSTSRLDVHHRARKEINDLPGHLRQKVDEFLATALQPGGMTQIRANRGRWNFEKLNQFGQDSYSVRLNDGYRVLFDLKGDELTIRRVNKGQIHGG
ncbi:MAG: hypothetical protein KF802_15775 [Bdellovibrionaceae bacterium]|nr:hypothetical protein [Pseudobdellovibrionaceae bacterium]MBX3034918.1 hypothetical protein [Pseudobdellovibrionaceae bacterium]